MSQIKQCTLSGDIKEDKLIQLFITRNFNDKNIKVTLDKTTKIYKQTYKGINFFVYRNIFKMPVGWIAIEIQTGTSIIEGFPTRKDTIKSACERIDKAEGLDELIASVIDTNKSAEIMSVKEFLEYVK